MKVFVVITVLAVILSTVESTQKLQKCSGIKKPEDNDVTIGSCETPPCQLKRRTEISIEYKYTPDHDIKKATNKVFGIIAGLPLPFVGVDNTDACGNFYNDSGEKVGCPLKAGTTYTFKNSIKILPVYPKVNVVVEWGLTDAVKGTDVFCFKVPAKITS